MSSKEKIETEYMLYEVDCLPTKEIATRVVLDVFMDDMDEAIQTSETAITDNFKDEQLAKVKNFFLDIMGYEGENIEQFTQDSSVVLRIGSLAESYKGYFDKMKETIDGDNFVEMYKLAMFTYQSFASNYHYLESLRDSIRFAVDGIVYYGTGEDTQDQFNEFFEEIFSKIKSNNKVYRKEEM